MTNRIQTSNIEAETETANIETDTSVRAAAWLLMPIVALFVMMFVLRLATY